VRTPDGRTEFDDVSNAGTVGTVRRGDKVVRVFTAIAMTWHQMAQICTTLFVRGL
jgi:hypothetical protein